MSKKIDSDRKEAPEQKKFSRRDFLAISGSVVAADVLLAATPGGLTAKAGEKQEVSYPEAKAYLVYDSKKCMGCTTCMLACSLTHYGAQSLSLSRIQIIQDSFGKFPDDIKIAVCRQCVTPPCVINCPVGAAYITWKNGNIRRINERSA
jgi:protein NrfC